jgi:hypothetical protein
MHIKNYTKLCQKEIYTKQFQPFELNQKNGYL